MTGSSFLAVVGRTEEIAAAVAAVAAVAGAAAGAAAGCFCCCLADAFRLLANSAFDLLSGPLDSDSELELDESEEEEEEEEDEEESRTDLPTTAGGDLTVSMMGSSGGTCAGCGGTTGVLAVDRPESLELDELLELELDELLELEEEEDELEELLDRDLDPLDELELDRLGCSVLA